MARTKQSVLSKKYPHNKDEAGGKEAFNKQIVQTSSPAASLVSTTDSGRCSSPSEEREKNDESKRAPNNASIVKCNKCGTRQARKGCTNSACLACCKDEGCEAHRESREQAQWREKLLAGTTDIQLRAKEKRSKLIKKGRFREKEFAYIGDTVIIWNIHEYMANPKWKEDALRKASRRNARRGCKQANSTKGAPTKSKRHMKSWVNIRREKFHRIMEGLYQKSLGN